MALTTEQKASFLFKQSLGVAETNVIRDFFEESLKGRILVLNNQIWVQSGQIPATAPALADGATSGVVQYFQARSMTAVAGVSNSFFLSDLIDSIPFNFGDGSYNYTITNSSGQAIPFGQGDWLVNNATGTLTFYGSVPSGMPPKISFYKYVGSKGAGGEASLPAFYSVATIADRDALTAKQGDWCNVAATNQTYGYTGSEWITIQSAGAVSKVNEKTGNVVLTAADVGAIPTSEKAAANGVATLGADGKIPTGQLPEFAAGVSSVNTLTGAVTLTTKQIDEDPSTNFYFTDARAKAAAVVNSTAGSQTDQAPSVSAIKAYADSKVLNSTAGSETDKAASVSAMKAYVSANALMTSGGTLVGAITMGAQNPIRFADSDSSNYVSFRGAANIASNITWTLPAADGTNGQFIKTDGSGNLSWASATATNGTLTHPTTGSTFEFGTQNAGMTGVNNTAIGVSSGVAITSGQFNTLYGRSAGLGLDTGSTNTMIGAYAGQVTKGGSDSTFIGYNAGPTNTTGNSNTAIGSTSLLYITTGSGNVAVGASSGLFYNSTSSYNTAINSTGPSSQTVLSGTVAIGSDSSGNGAVVSANNQFVLGTINHRYVLPGIIDTAVVVGPNGTAAGSGGVIRLRELAANGTNFVALRAADTLAADVTWTLPTADGTSGQFLSTNGSGSLSWASAGGSPTTTVIADYTFESSSLSGKVNFENTTSTLNIGVWSSAGSLNAARRGHGSCGSQKGAIAASGSPGTTPFLTSTEKFNGLSWSTTGSVTTAVDYTASAGNEYAALIFGGFTTTSVTNTQRFDGSAWSNTGSLTTTRRQHGGAGSQNAALAVGGIDNTSTTLASVEKYNGSTWSSAGNLSLSRYALGTTGTQNAGLAFLGFSSSASLLTELYNGNVWYSGPSLFAGNGRYSFGYCGVQNATHAFCGIAANNSLLTGYSLTFNQYYWSQLSQTPNSPKANCGGSGSQNNALCHGGDFNSNTTVQSFTEQYYGIVNCGFEATYRGINNYSNLLTDSNLMTLNCGQDSGILEIGLNFYKQNGNSISEINWINELNINSVPGVIGLVIGTALTARTQHAGTGTLNSSLIYGGAISGVSATSSAEKFNGIIFTSTGSLSQARYGLGQAGIQNAALASGGNPFGTNLSSCEKFNGSTWSTTGSLTSSRREMGSCGVQNAALLFGGVTDTGTLKFNGSTWSIAWTSLHGGNAVGSGAQNAAISPYGGSSGKTSYFYNGLVWYSGPQFLNSVILYPHGSQNSCLGSGGGTDRTSTEIFNGFSWALNGNTSTGRSQFAASGSANAALSSCGRLTSDSSIQAIAEKIIPVIPLIPISSGNATWSSSGNLSVGKTLISSAGVQDAALCIGGNTTGGTPSSVCEKFNGSTWGTTGSLSAAKNGTAGCGVQNAALCSGGSTAAAFTATAVSEKFNGATWSTTGSLSAAKAYLSSAGSQWSGLAFNGTSNNTSGLSTTEAFNGLTWSTITASVFNACYYSAGTGNRNSAIVFGGSTDGTSSVSRTEKLMGSSFWSTGGSLNTARLQLAGAGNQNSALAFGGTTGIAITSSAEKFNGYTWYTTGILSSAKYGLAGCGTQSNGLAFGGYDGANFFSSTEKYIETLVGPIKYG